MLLPSSPGLRGRPTPSSSSSLSPTIIFWGSNPRKHPCLFSPEHDSSPPLPSQGYLGTSHHVHNQHWLKNSSNPQIPTLGLLPCPETPQSLFPVARDPWWTSAQATHQRHRTAPSQSLPHSWDSTAACPMAHPAVRAGPVLRWPFLHHASAQGRKQHSCLQTRLAPHQTCQPSSPTGICHVCYK